MSRFGSASLPALLLAGAASASAACLAPFAKARAADCPTASLTPLPVGTVASVAPGAPRSYAVPLDAGQGIIVDLTRVAPGADAGDHEGDGAPVPPARTLRLCDAQGRLLAPLAGEVFAKGGSVTSIDDGERLRFLAGRAGGYIVSVAGGDESREILVRRRDGGTARTPVIQVELDSTQKGIASSSAPMLYSFSASAGQWVEIRSTSEKDTVLRLAGPDRKGDYAQIAENDDSDGLNPRLRRRLATAGTYFVQVDSLSAEPGEFEFALKRMAPPAIASPVALRPGASVAGRLADADDSRLYAITVQAGRQYRLDLTAPYDAVVAIGAPNPVAGEDGDETVAGFAEVRSEDKNTSGTERLTFTARTDGALLVRVKCFGIGEGEARTDGGYSLTLNDLGA